MCCDTLIVISRCIDASYVTSLSCLESLSLNIELSHIYTITASTFTLNSYYIGGGSDISSLMVSTVNDKQLVDNTTTSDIASAVKYQAPLATTPKRMRETTILLEEIGRGAGGTVYKAIHVPTMRLVAVKVSTIKISYNYTCHCVHLFFTRIHAQFVMTMLLQYYAL